MDMTLATNQLVMKSLVLKSKETVNVLQSSEVVFMIYSQQVMTTIHQNQLK